MKQLSDFDKGYLCGLLEAGMSIRKVAERMGVTTRTVQKWWDKFRNVGNTERQIGSGRPCKTTDKQKAALILSVKRNRFKPVTKLADQWIKTNELTCSLRTARRIVLQGGYKSYNPAIRIPLGHYHRVARLQWARDHQIWLDEWKSILWTDESRFALDFHDGRIRVRRLKSERYTDCCILEHDRYGGGSVMVWAGIWWESRTEIVFCKGSMTGERYLNEIVRPIILPTVRNKSLTLQQDNARPHKARIVMAELNSIQNLSWPARSPDLSPIEHVWDEVGRRLRDNYEVPAVDLNHLSARIWHEWNSIPQETIQRVILSMPQRLMECITKRGGHTSY